MTSPIEVHPDAEPTAGKQAAEGDADFERISNTLAMIESLPLGAGGPDTRIAQERQRVAARSVRAAAAAALLSQADSPRLMGGSVGRLYDADRAGAQHLSG